MTAERSKVKDDRQHRFQVLGSRPVRADGTDKVTGRAAYGADIRLPDMLYGKVLRSPHAHAKIRSIDLSKARALRGVRAVITAEDLEIFEDEANQSGQRDIWIGYDRDNLLANEKVLYHGHAVAAVSAIDPHIAQEALALIEIDYEVLPAVMDARQAMNPSAPILLDNLRTDELGKKGDETTNIASHHRYQRGDVSIGFIEAAAIVEREFTTATVHQGYIEPQSATALYTADDQLTIWSSTQGAFDTRKQVSDILHLPLSRICVIPMEIGGAFGGKYRTYLEPLVTLLSLKSGNRPVKMEMSRAEVLMGTGPSPGSYMRIKIGTDKHGRITAAEAYLLYEGGAYPGTSVGYIAGILFAPYRIENLLSDGYEVVVTKTRSSAYRGVGSAIAISAVEMVVDELCQNLEIDPLAFRAINGVQEGDQRQDGQLYSRIGYQQTVDAARNHPHYHAPLKNSNCGRGVSSAVWQEYGGRSSASASVNPDGMVSLVLGSVDLSGTKVSISMQLAETLGVPVDSVRPVIGGTDSVGFTDGSYGSRTTFAGGWAAYTLGQELIDIMVAGLAALWKVEAELIDFTAGEFSAGERRIKFKELANWLDETGSSVTASVSVNPEGFGASSVVQIVDVEVDPETGKVDILRYTVLQDVGKAIHPSYVESQLQGGAVQGIGWALHEGYVYDEEGHLLNSSLLDYRIPTFTDVPMIDTVLIEVPNPNHPYGVRGAGEPPILPAPAAVANAVYHAVGERFSELPITPARILEAIEAQKH